LKIKDRKEKEKERERERKGGDAGGAVKIYEIIGSERDLRKIVELFIKFASVIRT